MAKPKILISECFLSPCRYNGAIINDEFVSRLLKYIDYIYVCPEVSIGLGVPRDPILIQISNNTKRLIQPSTNLDLTDKMLSFSKNFIKYLNIDGAILKSKSPSCGVYSAKYFLENKMQYGKGAGFFANELINNFPHIPIEEEKRLIDETLRYHFLVRIFAISDMRETFNNISSYKELIDFHTRYKLMLMYYNQNIMRNLGKLVASSSKEPIDSVISTYKEFFLKALNTKPKRTNHINTIEHMFGYFSKRISRKERMHFMEVLRLFKENKIDLILPLEMIKAFALRFEEEYILKQTYLEPFPKELL